MKKLLLGICLFLFVCGFASSAEKQQPNIVYILADDLGWTDLACQGSKYYETPNIDRLAAKGNAVDALLQFAKLRAHSRRVDERTIRVTHRNLFGGIAGPRQCFRAADGYAKKRNGSRAR
jgi:hypothetical protein